MPGPAPKTLADRIRDNSFRPAKHGDLLAGDPVTWPALARIQDRYLAAAGDPERAAVARAFAKAISALHEQLDASPDEAPDLETELRRLGPPGSARRTKAFFPRFLTLENGARFDLERWEGEFIDEGWRRQDDRRIYKELLLGIPRGNGKTPFAAGIGTLTLLEAPPVPAVFQAAGSKEQAKVGLSFATSWAGEDAELGAWLRAKARSLELRGRRGSFTIVSADGRLFHGRKPHGVLIDEWWLYENAREEQVYVAGQTALDKVEEAFLLATTTAGYDKTSQLGLAYERALKLPLEHRREGFLRIARDIESGFLMWWYGMPDGYDLDLENDQAVLRALRLANPSSFVDCDALLRSLRRPTTDPYEWLRLHLNAWTTTRDAWLPLGCYSGLRSTEPIPDGAEIWVAVDAALKHDTTAVVWAAVVDGKIKLQGRAWAARDGVPAHEFHAGGRIRNRDVMEWIDRELGGRYKVREIVADSRFFDDYIWELGQRGYLVAEFVQQSREMRDAEQHFYEAATGGGFSWHDPEGHMAAHVEATSAIATRYGFKVDNPQKSKPIDLATGQIMARERCAREMRTPEPWGGAW